MSNIFDGLQNTLFNTATKTFGYDATWTPSGGSLQSARVLYNSPTNVRKIGEYEYNPNIHTMEYKMGDFEGLFESNRSNESNTVTIEIEGVVHNFAVLEVLAFWDGKTYRAQLQEI